MNDIPLSIRRYAIRRTNPFLGVSQVLETKYGRAVSTNGLSWNIEILTERNDLWGSLNRNAGQLAYYRFGLWSAQDGLVHRPLFSHLDEQELKDRCRQIVQELKQSLDQLPFPLEDRKELWLFDEHDRIPLALLATLLPDIQPAKPEPRYWAACLGAGGMPGQHRFPQTESLEQIVKKRAGFNIKKRWITRDAQGKGTAVEAETSYPNEVFPDLLLQEDWPSEEERELVQDYLDWIAPSLLTLQHLDPEVRSRLEHKLSLQANVIEYHWRLFPEMIHPELITASRVQNRLQLATKNA